MEGLEVIRKQLKSIDRKLKRAYDDYNTYSTWKHDREQLIKKLEKQKEDLKEIIKPYEFTENLEGKK